MSCYDEFYENSKQGSHKMVECSLCSLMSFIFRFTYNTITAALDYPIIIVFLSLLVTLVFITNVQTAKLISDFGTMASRHCGIKFTTSGPLSGNGDDRAPRMDTLFDYGAERGPHTWQSSDYNQSPINIIDDDVRNFPIREMLTWNHYDDLPLGIQMENNGHTVVVRAAYSGNAPTLSGADLLASYTFVELCFRWSLLNNEGSEHMLNYRKLPLELQVMHRTGPGGDCTSSYDLLMVAYFFDISRFNNPYLDPIIQNLHRIQKPGTKIEIPPFPLAYLCHQFRTGFYSYGGSLTEPPCYQGAEWFIYPEPMAISERQLNEFRQILSADGKTKIVRNARPVQNLHDSQVVNFNQYNPLNSCAMPVAESVENMTAPEGDED